MNYQFIIPVWSGTNKELLEKTRSSVRRFYNANVKIMQDGPVDFEIIADDIATFPRTKNLHGGAWWIHIFKSMDLDKYDRFVKMDDDVEIIDFLDLDYGDIAGSFRAKGKPQYGFSGFLISFSPFAVKSLLKSDLLQSDYYKSKNYWLYDKKTYYTDAILADVLKTMPHLSLVDINIKDCVIIH